jgi:hypothetical protein
MSLAVSVGHLAFLLADDAEAAERFRGQLAEVNRLLAANGLPSHQEPETLPPRKRGVGRGSFPYSWVHYLRRALAYARQAPGELQPLGEDNEPGEDLRLDREYSRTPYSHLICHSDCDGYYVPIDFPQPLYAPRNSRLTGGILGSSHQALQELIQVAPLIDIKLKDGVLSHAQASAIAAEEEGTHPYWIERQVWLTLYEAMQESIARKSLVVFC